MREALSAIAVETFCVQKILSGGSVGRLRVEGFII